MISSRTKFFLDKLSKYKEELQNLIDELEGIQFSTYKEKENSHLPVNNYQNNFQQTIKTKMNYENQDDIIKKIIVGQKIQNINQKKFKNVNSIVQPPINKPQQGVSLYPVTIKDELERLIQNYQEEYKYIKNLKLALRKDKRNEKIYIEIAKKLKMTNRFLILKNKQEIDKKQYFGPNVNYIECLFITPPRNDFCMYSLYFNKTHTKICNSYIIIKNSKNEYHLFYGCCDFLNTTNGIENPTEQLLNNYLFKEHVEQNKNYNAFISSIEYKINNYYTDIQKYDKNVANAFCKYLQLYLKGINEKNNVNVKLYDTFENMFFNGIILQPEINKFGITINVELTNPKITIKKNTQIVNLTSFKNAHFPLIYNEKMKLLIVSDENNIFKLNMHIFDYDNNDVIKFYPINDNFSLEIKINDRETIDDFLKKIDEIPNVKIETITLENFKIVINNNNYECNYDSNNNCFNANINLCDNSNI